MTTPQGCWSWVRAGVDGRGRAALFLDRDGVVIEDVDYLGDPAGVALIDGAAQTLAAFNRAAVPVVVVTNQSGVGRGYYDWAAFEAVQAELERKLQAEAGAWLDAVFACGAHADAKGAFAIADHPWRKPNPGMLLEAGARLGLDLAGSAMVGDRVGDLQAARSAALGRAMLVATGQARPEAPAAALALRTAAFEPMIANDISAAAALVEGMTKGGAPC